MSIISGSFFNNAFSLLSGGKDVSYFKLKAEAARSAKLINTAADLVNTLESSRKPKEFKVLFDQAPKHLSIDNANVFSELVSRIKETLDGENKSFTVANFIEAQNTLLTKLEQEQKVDINA